MGITMALKYIQRAGEDAFASASEIKMGGKINIINDFLYDFR